MGRKIPGRKHRGVKDPEKQRAERLAKLKDKINAPPSNPDDQQISKSLSRIMELKKRVEDGIFNKKHKNRDKQLLSQKKFKEFKGRPEKQIPKLERLSGESDREFKHRMNRICSESIREAAFENKYQVDIRRNEQGQVISVDKRPKDELELLVKKLKREKNAKKSSKGKKKSQEKKEKLSKSQKWKLKQAEKKKRKIFQKEEDYSFESHREHVKFGEITHAPPTLVVPRKVGKLGSAPRPGKKELLLKSMLTNEKSSSALKPSNKQKDYIKGVSMVSKTIDKKAKRKNLPHALRRQLDKQQNEVIESYKLLKSRKYSST